jgi:hypothetical protein
VFCAFWVVTSALECALLIDLVYALDLAIHSLLVTKRALSFHPPMGKTRALAVQGSSVNTLIKTGALVLHLLLSQVICSLKINDLPHFLLLQR